MDGIYLTADELLLDGNGTAVNVADMTGNVRDDGAQFTSYSTSSSVSQVLTDQGYNATDILGSNEFLTPHGANSTFDIFQPHFAIRNRCHIPMSDAVYGVLSGLERRLSRGVLVRNRQGLPDQ